MNKVYDVEVTVSQIRVYKIEASNPGTAEAMVTELVEDDPKGLDGDVDFEVLESVSESVIAYDSEEG